MDPPLRDDEGQPMPPPGPPYLPLVATPGGRVTMAVDTPICAVLIGLFLVAGASHLVMFARNRSRGHKFVFSALLLAFCLARTAALSTRIASAARPADSRIGVAATVLLAAGVLLLYLVNLLLAQRLVRARRPDLGWRPAVTWAFRLVFVGVGATLVMVVAATVHSFFTPDPAARAADRVVQLVASTALAVLALAPAPIVAAAALSARRPKGGRPAPERFGQGSARTQAALVIGTSLLLALGAGFRTGVAFDLRPLSQPAWFHGRGPFYAFNYGIELVVVVTYAVFRFDRRFHVPDGSAGPGDYSRAVLRHGSADGENGPAVAALEAAGRSIGSGDKQRPAEMEDKQRREQQQALEGLFELQGDALTMADSARGTRPPTARDREKEVRGSFIEALTGPNFPETPRTTTTDKATATTPGGGSSGSDGEGIVAAAVAAAAALAAADADAAVVARRSVVVAAATAAIAPRDEYDVPAGAGAGDSDEDGEGEGREHPSPLLFRAPTTYSDGPASSALSPPTPSSAGYVTPPEPGTATNDSRRCSFPPAAQWEERARDELERRASQDPRRRSMM
ncbi:hypothetical protein RB601_003199 [Gaeumannomyces tritici]